MRNKTTAAVVMIVLLAVLVPAFSSEGATDVDVLMDKGNGETSWGKGTGATVIEIIQSAAIAEGLQVSIESGMLSVNGMSSTVVGSDDTGGSLSEPGSTGVKVTTSWRTYGWNGSSWESIDPTSDGSGSSAFALGFYPDGIVPVETPDCPIAWTMFRGDSRNTGNQDATFSAEDSYVVKWSDKGASFANPLYAGGYVFQKYSTYTTGENKGYAVLACIDIDTGEHKWEFRYISGMNYESSTPLIVGDYIYVGTMTGYIYKIPWRIGPGTDNENVTSINGSSFSDAPSAPNFTKDFDVGNIYDAGFTSLVYNSGTIYVSHSNGMVYCFDLNLNLIWSYQLDGGIYFIAPSVYEGHVYTGALNGHLYIFDQATGGCEVDQEIFQVEIRGKKYGGLGQISITPNGDNYTLIFTVTDGLGMSQMYSGLAVYDFDPSSNTVVKRYLNSDMGTFGRYVSPVSTDGFTGAYVTVANAGSTSLIRIDQEGNLETISKNLKEIHSAGVVVNDRWIYLTSYSSADPIYIIDLETGKIEGVAKCAPEVRNFNMASPLVLGDTLVGNTDSGTYSLYGKFMDYSEPEKNEGAPIILYLGALVLIVVVILALIWAVIHSTKGEDHPFKYLKDRAIHYLYGDTLSHNTRNKHRLKFVLAIGAVLIFVSFTLCISIGSTSIMNPLDAYSALFSAISKGGEGLDTVETTVFVSRLPRTIAAMSVGIGLAIAGSVYQAIIRNPLVDPYIMGVSSGAGIAAIAVIAFDFTFFGLFSSHSIFLTAISAMIGGLVAFGCTMIIAEKAGGSSINYVLSGVVVGLAFSALQTIMLTMAGNKLSNALTWLYGSFAEVTWAQVGILLFMSVFLSLVPMFWAKEFNLVLLGEDQAREMGLNVRKFNRLMLILASVLTSVCVAFCGIIGFVGLVIPHLCRMLLGSDHRMVLPASFCFGAVMLMLADLLARTGYYGMELPVGAITTVIGIPVFAYLLIKKGRIYDG